MSPNLQSTNKELEIVECWYAWDWFKFLTLCGFHSNHLHSVLYILTGFLYCLKYQNMFDIILLNQVWIVKNILNRISSYILNYFIAIIYKVPASYPLLLRHHVLHWQIFLCLLLLQQLSCHMPLSHPVPHKNQMNELPYNGGRLLILFQSSCNNLHYLTKDEWWWYLGTVD